MSAPRRAELVYIMRCPSCGHSESTVAESRASDSGTRRRRECQACQKPFTTVESVQHTLIMVVKKDGRREEFQREKLLRALRTCCRKRPLATGAVDAIVDDIEQRLMASGSSEVPSRVVAEMVITHLERLDPIAYIRFASVYRQFVSIDDMLRELQLLAQSPLPPPEQHRLFDDDFQRAVAGDGDLPRTPTPIESARSTSTV